MRILRPSIPKLPPALPDHRGGPLGAAPAAARRISLPACCLPLLLAAGVLAFPGVGQSAADLPSLLQRSEDGLNRLGFSLLFDLEGYYIDQRPGGLLFSEHDFLNPRLSLFFEHKLGDQFYVFLQGRVDQGFDPHTHDLDARLDEYLLRWTPWENNLLNLQAGKFATVVGSWVNRHDSWANPFVTAPLPYENVTLISDHLAPRSAQAFLSRLDVEETPKQKGLWLPIVWGPAYTSGASLFGSFRQFDYAFEFKNASISSRPEYWGPEELTWKNPTYSGRVGFRPDPAWNFGVSASYGPYLVPSAAPSLPANSELSDFNQATLAYDMSYAWHHWQLWGELFLSRFAVPNVGNADTLAYYLEGKYKITAELFAALRWNQQFFGKVPNGQGQEETWGVAMSRVDVALGFRCNRQVQLKLQYSYSHQESYWQKGEQLVAAQLTCKF